MSEDAPQDLNLNLDMPKSTIVFFFLCADKGTNLQTLNEKIKKSFPDILIISNKIVRTADEIFLASFLTDRAMQTGTNIAREKKYELLLWVTGKTDISTAIRASEPTGDEMIIGILLNIDRIEQWQALMKSYELIKITPPESFSQKATELEIEKISLSRTV